MGGDVIVADGKYFIYTEEDDAYVAGVEREGGYRGNGGTDGRTD